MSLMSTVQKGIARASKLTASFQGTVLMKPWIGESGKGVIQYDTPVSIQALFQPKVKQYSTPDGKIIQVVGILTVLDPITPNGASKRQEPVDPRDLFVLPSGEFSPIVDADQALYNPETEAPILNMITLGKILS